MTRRHVKRLEQKLKRRTGDKSRFICVYWQENDDYTVQVPVDLEGVFSQAEIEELSKDYEEVVILHYPGERLISP